MKTNPLATKRRWNGRTFLVLVGLIVPASFAIWPYSLHLQNTSIEWVDLLLNSLISILLYSVLGGIGLLLANRIGLGMPLVEAWTKHEPAPYRLRDILAIAWMTAVALVLLSLFLHAVVFDPPLEAMLAKLGMTLPEGANTPPLYGFLAAISAGITEETLYRLFGLSLLAWLVGRLFHDAQGRPKPVAFWTANILFALAFGAGHLPKVAAMGLPINTFVVFYTLLFNSLGGLLFGWMFWTFGFESAILAHFFADVILYTFLPFIDMQTSAAARSQAMAVVVAVIVVTFLWAWRSLVAESRWHRPQWAP